MADPVVHLTNGLPDSGTGNITTLGQTLLDGANATHGAIADAAATAGGTGTFAAKLRAISRDLVANIVLAAGSAIIGKVGVDQTTPGTTDSVTVATGQGAGATIGATGDAVVAAGATGSVSAKLRAISRDIIANIVLAAGANVIGGVTIADGSDATFGAKADAKSTATDATAISAVSIWKQISASVQAIATSVAGTLTVATHAVTGSGNFATTVADGANVTIGTKTDAKSTSTDATSISIMSVLKQISASVQATMGFALNTGTSSATTLRTTLASDSAGIIATGTQAAPSAAYLSTVAAGDVAAAGTDTGNPVKIGGVANSATPTKVTAGQRVAAWFGLRGEQVCVGATRENKGRQKTSVSNTTGETTIVTAVASTFLDLYGLILANTGATTTKVDIRDTTGGSIIATIEVPTLETRGFMLPVDSAVPQATVNTNWTAQCAAATTAMEVTALFVKNT